MISFVLVSCVLNCLCYLFFFFKQKTAYDVRISDWSSDVCSSDLDSSPISSVNATSIGEDLRLIGLGVARKPTESRPNSTTCPAIAMPSPVFSARSIRPSVPSLALLARRHQRDAVEPGVVQFAHPAHHAAGIGRARGAPEARWRRIPEGED